MNPAISAFTVEKAAKLTGLSESQLRRWDAKGLMLPSLGWENRRRPFARIYTFSDLVALRTLAKLKERGVSTQQLRKIRSFLDRLTDDPWNRRFWVNRQTGATFFSYEDAIVAAEPAGQLAMIDLIELGEIAGDIRARLDRMESRVGQHGQIVTDRHIHSGVPIFSGTRIPVSTIIEFLNEGANDEEILSEYPRLTVKDLEAARKVRAA